MHSHDERINELLTGIKKRIVEITGGETGMLVYLKEVVFPENSNRGAAHSMITVSCLFLNEEGLVCADLFRTGAAGFMECVYGNIINSIGIKGLEEINTALENGRWYVSETPGSGDRDERKKVNKKRTLHIPFKFSILMKGA